MLKFINALLVVTVLVSGFLLYSLEHKTRGLERSIAKTNGEIADEVEAIKLLNAEWSSLTRPERLQKLSETHLDLVPLAPDQLITERDIAARVPASVEVKLEKEGTDPIGDLLQKMQ